MKRYTEEHEWVIMSGGLAVVGITAFAAAELGDITYVELPAVGKAVQKGESLCVIESVKAASDVFSPVSGAVAEVNGDLENDPGIVNASPEEKGWICRMSGVSQAEVDKLMTADQYNTYTAGKKK